MHFNKIKISAIILFVILTCLLVFLFTSKSSSSVKTPAELIADNKDQKRVRVGGRVSSDQIDYSTSPAFVLTFNLEDRDKPDNKIKTIYRGIKPDMFTGGRDVLIDGDYKNGVLEASSLLTQCPSKYEPKLGTQASLPVGHSTLLFHISALDLCVIG